MTTLRKSVLITGAAGGLGKALASEFFGRGWHVIEAVRTRADSPPGEALPQRLTDAGQPSRAVLTMDVTDTKQIEAGMARVGATGPLHCLVANAGVASDALSWQISDEEWAHVLDVNLKGAFLCLRAAARLMAKQRDGHLIMISSHAGRAGARGQASYAAAKAGLIGMTQSIARELGSRNVRANAVMPGVLETKMTARLKPEQMQAFASANALGRINSLNEVAQFVSFLAGMQNVSGQVFQLDSRITPWS